MSFTGYKLVKELVIAVFKKVLVLLVAIDSVYASQEDVLQVHEHKMARQKSIEQENQFKLDNDRIEPVLLAEEVHREFKEHARVLAESKDKDVVVFLGKTGAGKSTLINFIANKAMKRVGQDLVLQDPKDEKAMVVGCGGDSETIYPKFIHVEGLLLCDLPGFGDTAGTVRNLLNAAFIREILVKSRSIRFVIVAGEPEFDAGRGEIVKGMIDSVSRLIGTTTLQQSSALAITKARAQTPQLESQFVLGKIQQQYHSIFNTWFTSGRFGFLRHVDAVQDEYWNDDKVRDGFRTLIKGVAQAQVPSLDISVIYPHATSTALERMFSALMMQKFESLGFLSASLSDLEQAIEDLTLTGQQASGIARERFWEKIDKEISSMDHICLLKSFCGTPYGEALRKFKDTVYLQLKVKKEERMKKLESLSVSRIKEGVEKYYREEGCIAQSSRVLAALSEEFQGAVYRTVFGDISDTKEKDVMKKQWSKWSIEFREKMVDEYKKIYDLRVKDVGVLFA